MVVERAHYSGRVVYNYEDNQSINQAIPASKEIAEPASNSGKNELNHVPKFFHRKIPPTHKMRSRAERLP